MMIILNYILMMIIEVLDYLLDVKQYYVFYILNY